MSLWNTVSPATLLLSGLLVLAGAATGCGDPNSSPSPSPIVTPTPDDGDEDSPTPVSDAGCLPTPTPAPPPLPCDQYSALYLDSDHDGFATDVFVKDGCTATPGTSRIRGDCNDSDDTIYPGAEEQCDGIDHNCDQIPVDPDAPRFFFDADADGFGVDSTTVCMQTLGYSPARGDCNDDDASVYPGAADRWGDGFDDDCGGTDAEEPHVGFNCRSYPAIQMALEAAQDGMTIWVGPGVYHEHLSWLGKAVAVRSTRGPDETEVSAGGQASAVQFVTGEGPDSVVEGLAITEGYVGYGWDGAGLRAIGASPTIRSCWFRGNMAEQDCRGGAACQGGRGGGVYLEASSTELTDSVFVNNYAHQGGGLAVAEGSDVLVQRTLFIRNWANYGGALATNGSSLHLDHNRWVSNSAYWDGGGLFSQDSTVTLQSETVLSNTASGVGGALKSSGGSITVLDSTLDRNAANSGAAVALSGGRIRVSNLTLSNSNLGAYGGAQLGISGTDDYEVANSDIFGGSHFGISLAGAGQVRDSQVHHHHSFGIHIQGAPTLSRCTVSANAGGIQVEGDARIVNTLITANLGSLPALTALGGSPVIDQCTIAGNMTDDFGRGGGIQYLGQDLPGLELKNSIVAYNWGYNLKTDAQNPGIIRVSSTALYNPVLANHDVTDLEDSNLELQPDFMHFSDDGNPANDDFHLPPDSPLRGSGNRSSALQESSAELGMYGGADADRTYYADQEGDGLYDGWESLQGLDVSKNDAGLDPDADGLSNLGELKARTEVAITDTDGDGSSDGDEVNAGASPIDWYSQPGKTSPGDVVASIPADFPTIQGALDAIQTSGTVEVGAGTFDESLTLRHKNLVLRSVSGARPVLNGLDAPVLSLLATVFDVRGLTLSHGDGDYGGGVRIGLSEGTLRELVVTRNSAGLGGGGIAALSSRLVLNDTLLSANSLATSGGGLYLKDSDADINRCSFQQNNGILGAGLYADDSHLQMTESTFSANRSEQDGGGAYLTNVTGSLDEIAVTENINGNTDLSSGGAGGGIYLSGTAPSLSHITFVNNSSTLGGGLYIENGSPVIRNALFQANRAISGGGLALDSSSATLEFCTVVDNEGEGLQLGLSAVPTVANSILAYNIPLNVTLLDPKGSTGFRYNALYNHGSNASYEPALSSTNLVQTPGFVAYTNDHNAANDDYHLVPLSPLINAGDPLELDPDGSRAELGYYGGPTANRSYYSDLDEDGMYDAWEVQHGLNPNLNDALQDADLDGLTNLQELNASSNPMLADSDGDGASDGSEVNAGTVPVDFYSQPGVSGYGIARVPGDFPTIQSALNAMLYGGKVHVEAGTYPEDLSVVYRDAHLIGIDGMFETRLEGSGSTHVLESRDAQLTISGFTVTGGSAAGGVGIRIMGGEAHLSHLSITDNLDGGIEWDSASDVTLTDSLLFGNLGTTIYAQGGSISHCKVYENQGPSGGVATLRGVDVAYTEFSHNTVDMCAVIASAGLTMDHSVIASNSLRAPLPYPYSDNGTGLCLDSYYYGGEFSIVSSVIAYNSPINVSIYDSYPYSQVHITYSSLYNPPLDQNINRDFPLDLTTTTEEPDFLSYDAQDLPQDFHLGLSSPLVGVGPESDPNPDGSAGDMGLYGGESGDLWDRDDDGYPDYFWPGTRDDAPQGYSPTLYDCNDLDPSIKGGSSCIDP